MLKKKFQVSVRNALGYDAYGRCDFFAPHLLYGHRFLHDSKTIQSPVAAAENASHKPIEQPENSQLVTVQVDEFSSYNIITQNWDRLAGSKQDLIVALSEASSPGVGREPIKLRIEAHEDSIHGAIVAALDAGRETHFASFEVNTVEQFD